MEDDSGDGRGRRSRCAWSIGCHLGVLEWVREPERLPTPRRRCPRPLPAERRRTSDLRLTDTHIQTRGGGSGWERGSGWEVVGELGKVGKVGKGEVVGPRASLRTAPRSAPTRRTRGRARRHGRQPPTYRAIGRLVHRIIRPTSGPYSTFRNSPRKYVEHDFDVFFGWQWVGKHAWDV